MDGSAYGSHKYRVTLLVTFEEELAIMKLFSLNGWAFIRDPDFHYYGQQQQQPVHVAVHQSEMNQNYVQNPYKYDNQSTENKTDALHSANSSETLDATENIELLTPQITEDSLMTDSMNMEHVNSNTEICNNVAVHEVSSVSNIANVTASNDDDYDDDAEYMENSYFRIPPHVLKGFAGNTEVLSKTKKMLLYLSNVLKGLSGQNQVTPDSVEKLNLDLTQLKEAGFNASLMKGSNDPAQNNSSLNEPVQNTRNVDELAQNTDTVNKFVQNTNNMHKPVQNSLNEPVSDIEDLNLSMTEQTTDQVRKDQNEIINNTIETRNVSTTPNTERKTKVKKHLKKGKQITKRKSSKRKTRDKRKKVEEKEEIPDAIKPKPILYEDGDAVRNEVDKHIDQMSLVLFKNEKLVCCMCKKAFSEENSFKSHADMCLSSLFNLRGSHVYKCMDCQAYFRQAFTLLRHRQSEVCVPGQTRKAGNVLTCKFCDKSYPTRRRSEYIHHLNMHNNKRPFSCEDCGKDFVRWTTLRDHKRIHTGEKPFKCKHCNMMFVSASGARNHEMIRHQDLPRKFVCEKCGASFKLRSRLSCHIKEVHDMPIIYTCEFCQKEFSRKGSLVIHRRAHINLRDRICEVCGKGFIRQAALTAHMKRHRNERSYFCKDCGKGFYSKMNLADHTRTHTGDKPFSCSICSYRCACYSNAVKHIRARHPEIQEAKHVINKVASDKQSSIQS